MDAEEVELTAIQEAGLRYVSCAGNGYRRLNDGQDVYYADQNGTRITNEQTLKRIRSLVIPPAWQNVWICPSPNGHLQATGIDAKGRKQYRYHPKWALLRSEKKFTQLVDFGKRLPLLKNRIKKDLRKRTFDRDKVCALAVAIMGETSFRAGNRAYEKANGSYGLTTLRNKHAKQVDTNRIFFKFIGKKGVLQQTYLKEKSLVKLLMQVKEIPGQRLFQYYDADGTVKQLESGDINNYLKEAMSLDVTCKNFRTWNGCLLALTGMVEMPLPATLTERKKNMLHVIDKVAQTLGNTRAVTKSHYIHPCILSEYEQQNLDSWIRYHQKRGTAPSATQLTNRLFRILCKKD
ncbi:DNA topoisomerase-1 [Sphingobacterium allocomposti]|uniref:DNA topoisomerase n=1 Tax=Sphingobacterium allocomposti TaxID=415956 RepID=A0A5S5DAA9_9SPHI|nr:DNA topoisomerase IB [Sphingobacterium composti Yoo et al. 2007 non Ten et al. 2007]TYP92464.1 DNA topoisomerase-1 [Sphingobacterium composti Yoo et al. 2007 non Ten et al. 2007]